MAHRRLRTGSDGHVRAARSVGAIAGPALSGGCSRPAQRLERHSIPDAIEVLMLTGDKKRAGREDIKFCRVLCIGCWLLIVHFPI